MSRVASIAGLGLVLGLFMMLVPVALLVVLQVWLCKKGGRLGLILPGLSLVLSLLLVLSMAAFQMTSFTGSLRVESNGQVIQEEHIQGRPALTAGAVGAIAGVFLVSNIPTVVFGGVWLHFKNRQDFQADLKKMRIEDLE